MLHTILFLFLTGVENVLPAQVLYVTRVRTLFSVEHSGRIENIGLS